MRAFTTAVVTGVGASFYFSGEQYTEAKAMAPVPFSQSIYHSYKLVGVQKESHDTKLFTFALPEDDMKLNFETPSCITLRYVDEKGNETVRPYTPLNLESDRGSFELLVKSYPNSKMSSHLHNMKVGDSIEVQGPWRTMNLKPDQYEHIGMLAGGTGVTPMYQIAANFLRKPFSNTKFSLVCANHSKDGMLLASRINKLANDNPGKLFVFHSLTSPPWYWSGYKGHITKKVIEDTMPNPKGSNRVMLLVSGPPSFMKTISGEKDGRAQGPLGGYLKEMGYTDTMVYKF